VTAVHPPARPRDRHASFERVALPLAPALYRRARRLTSRSEDAGDIVQETFLRAYRTFDSFQEGTNAKAWLFTILYSILSNRWRRSRRTPHEVSMSDMDARLASALSTDADAERSLLSRLEASVEVEAALRQLLPRYRAVILLVDVREMTYEEAAAALDCPLGTVRSRLARGRKALFLALYEYARRIRVLRGAGSSSDGNLSELPAVLHSQRRERSIRGPAAPEGTQEENV
jgi:RNA polymerase sigma-70 factor (ECF subfamily)